MLLTFKSLWERRKRMRRRQLIVNETREVMGWQEVRVDNEVTRQRNHMDFEREFSPLIKEQETGSRRCWRKEWELLMRSDYFVSTLIDSLTMRRISCQGNLKLKVVLGSRSLVSHAAGSSVCLSALRITCPASPHRRFVSQQSAVTTCKHSL